jgi:thiamine-monophosphate kinase
LARDRNRREYEKALIKMGEFALIERIFSQRAAQMRQAQKPDLIDLGIGDDAALLAAIAADEQLVVSTDMLVEGTHFFVGTDPFAIGYKSLAVNLSDLAAMGAAPLGFTLALALPQASDRFLEAFASGLFSLAQQHGCHLIGGDTTRGPLNVCITVFGRVPRAQVLRRDAARVGQDLWVSGQLGAAARAVQLQYQNQIVEAAMLARLQKPQARIDLGLRLRGIASSALDLSDGLFGDLAHIARASHVSFEVFIDLLPIEPALQQLAPDKACQLALCGGDDYELAFTADAAFAHKIGQISLSLGLPLTRIGRVTAASAGAPVTCLDATGVPLSRRWHQKLKPYEHF